MKTFFSKQMRKLRPIHEPQSVCKPAYPPAWPLYDDNHAKPKMNSQLLSPLFKKLSGELRIMIYKAALTDPSRFLHIMRNRWREGQKNLNRRRVAHYWCEDVASKLPTWQHSCYGECVHQNPGMMAGWASRSITETSDRLLSLLLTCRLIYCEALRILYQDNIFHFRGAHGLLAFESSLLPVQWHAVRHIHISTWYGNEIGWGVQERWWPPEDLLTWTQMGESLSSLPAIDSLRFDMIFNTGDERDPPLPRLMKSLMIRAFEPLKETNARLFEIEANESPSEEVWKALGDVNFVVTVRHRDWNLEYYGRILDVMLRMSWLMRISLSLKTSTTSLSFISYKSIHITDDTRDNSPPWKSPVIEFPPPESAPKAGRGIHKVECSFGNEGKPPADTDLDKALDAFCKDGQEIVGFGEYWTKLTDYPPPGETQFWGRKLGMHLTMGTETVNNGAPQPYEKGENGEDWCKSYDWKLGREDCMSVIRPIYGTCSKDGKLFGGDYTYRCVHYKLWPIWMTI